MKAQLRLEATIQRLAVVASALCGVGAIAAFYVVLVRVPDVAGTKLELLFGTLQGVAVGLLFAIAALLINLTCMVRRANRLLSLASVGQPNQGPTCSGSSEQGGSAD